MTVFTLAIDGRMYGAFHELPTAMAAGMMLVAELYPDDWETTISDEIGFTAGSGRENLPAFRCGDGGNDWYLLGHRFEISIRQWDVI